LVIFFAVCLPGYGLAAGSVGNLTTSCTGCADGFYQPTFNITCLACGTTLSFTYPGKRDIVSGVGATTIPGTSAGLSSQPGAKNADECLPWFYQMDESMGTHLQPYVYGSGTVANISTASACATRCDTTAGCVAATFVYATTVPGQEGNTTGVCYIIMQTANPLAPRLALKVVPLDFTSGSSVIASSGGQDSAAMTAAVRGKSASVTTGQYVIYNGHPVGSMLGVAINGDSGVVLPVATCKSTCDADSSCALFYHDGSRCYLRTGYEAEGARTFFNIVNTRIDLI
jgi:ribosomal protein S27E